MKFNTLLFLLFVWLQLYVTEQDVKSINTVLCLIKVNINTIELIVHTSCNYVLDIRCVTIKSQGRRGWGLNSHLPPMAPRQATQDKSQFSTWQNARIYFYFLKVHSRTKVFCVLSLKKRIENVNQ